MNGSKLEDLYYICKLVFDIHKTPIFFIDNKGYLAFEISPNFQQHPFYSSKEQLCNQLLQENSAYNFPVLEETSFLENFFSINLRLND